MMEGMPRLVTVEELFKGRHFDQEIELWFSMSAGTLPTN
jgi:hypothetical protein